MTADVEAAVAAAFRDEWGRIVAGLIRATGDWDLAEECAQDAFVMALRKWPSAGVPRKPGAWLTTVARNRAVDRLRRGTNEAAKLRQAAALAARTGEPAAAVGADHGAAEAQAEAEPEAGTGTETGDIDDDRLRLIFTCCHPALALAARVALTLRTLTGLTTAEIARAFLVPEATMAKRLVRAKHKIRDAGIPYRVPPAHLLPERTSGVLAVLYLLFNEGYAASSGKEVVRHDLCGEAIRLATALSGMMPDAPEAAGLLALMLFQHSRRTARVDPQGELVTLDTRTDPNGIAVISSAPRPSSTRHWTAHASARTSSRPRSPPNTPGRTRRPPRTGGRSRACTGCWPVPRPRRSWSSTGRSPSGWPTARPRGWRWSRSSNPRARSMTTTCSTRPGASSCAASNATARPPTVSRTR